MSTPPMDAATRARLAQMLKAKQSPKRYPIGYGQQRLWFLDQLEPNNIFYNTFRSYRLTGEVDVAALEKALNGVVARHAALRTTFAVEEGQPMQVVAPTLQLPLPVTPMTEADAYTYAAQVAATPFSLSEGPLVRWELLQIAPQEHWLLLTFHHIVIDGWSLNIFARELAKLYDGFRSGSPATLEPLPIQYSDFTRWQREWLSQPETLERELDHWRSTLAESTPLELPSDRPRPAVQRYEGAVYRFALPDDLATALRDFSRREGVTLFMTLLAGWYTFLYRHTGQTDINIGSPVAGRPRTETESLIGLFINTIVLRGDMGANPTLRELLQQVRRNAIAAFQHQDVPFEQVVNAVAPARMLNRSPLFDVMFALQNSPAVNFSLAGLAIESVAVTRTISAFDMTLALTDDEVSLGGMMEYNTDLFDEATIATWMARFMVLLRGMVADPTVRLDDLPLLTPEDEALVTAASHGVVMELPDSTIPALVATQAAESPTALAVISDHATLSYRKLHRRALDVAAHLAAQGVGRGDIVALYLPRSLELMVALLGVQYAGATYLPLDPTYPAERIAYMLADSGTQWVLTDTTHRAELPHAIHKIVVAEVLPATLTAPLPLTPDDTAYLLYTSGSTGQPKGVRISHRALLNHALAQAETYALTAQDRVLQFASISFDVAGEEIYPTWLRGGALVLRDDMVLAGVEALHDFINRHAITVLNPPTNFWHDWVAGLVATGLTLPPSVRMLIAGSEGAVTERLRQWWQIAGREVRWLNAYGPTEATVTSTMYEPTELPAAPIVPIGRPLANVIAYVLDSSLRPVAPGVIGDLYLGGTALAEGYHHRPDLTEERFITAAPQGASIRLYRTGDRVRLLRDGVLEFAGRTDDQIKLRGFRIELGEIEAALLHHPAVQNVAVTVRDNDTAFPFLAAYWVAHTGQVVTAADLRGYLAAHLPAYMLPATYTVMAELPLTPSGKINRRALPAPDSSATQAADGYIPTTANTGVQSPLVELITGVWETLLKRTDITPYANFFELGGHSLLATRVVARLRTLLNRDIPLRLLFEQPTIAGITELLEHQEIGAALPPLDVQPDADTHPLAFAQERLWFLEQYEPNTATYNIPASLILRGELDVAALEQALNALVERHDVLRTTFALQEGEPIQVVAPATFMPLPVLTTPPTEAGWQAEAHRFARQPFALEQEPPIRWALLAVAPDEHWLLLSFHHAMMDGWSVGLFTGELFALYRGEALPPLPIRYGDYARWQRAWLAEPEALSRERSYWESQLRNLPVLELPTDFPRPAHQSVHGAHQRWYLPATLMEQVETFSRAAEVTPFMTLLALYYTLLYRYTEQTDLAVGTPVAGRIHPATESVLGLFVNTLVLRGDLTGKPTFRALVERVRGMTLDAFSHQALPFEQVVAAVAPDRSLHHTPLFQTMFVWQGEDGNEPQSALRTEPLDVETDVARVELTIILSKSEGELRGLVEYNRDLFEQSTITRMMGHFETLLTHALAAPNTPIQQLPILAEAERAEISRWTAPYARELAPVTVAERFEENTRRLGDQLAVLSDGENLTYAELNRRANQWARKLQEHGVKREAVVGLSMPRTTDLIVAMVAIMKAGAAYLPLDVAYPAERLHYMTQVTAPSLILTTRELAAQLPPSDVPMLLLDEMDASDMAEDNLNLVGSPEQMAYIMFTSGSTGQPKGIAIANRGIVRLGQDQPLYRFSDQTWMYLAPLGFDASTLEIWGPLLGGGKVALFPESPPTLDDIAAAIDRFKITTLFLTAGLFHQMAEQHMDAFRNLHQLMAGGDVLSVATIRRIRQAHPTLRITNAYGPTESTTLTSCYPVPAAPVFRHSVPVGYPVANTDAVILDGNMRRVPAGVAGDLYTGGDGLALGYITRLDLTAERFLPHPYSTVPGARIYQTGDRARYLPDGAIEFLGRTDDQVKVRGYRIELGEIEVALESHPSVERAVATVRLAPTGDQLLVAYVVGDITSIELRTFLQQSMPDYMVPNVFVPLDELPLTTNSKVDRNALPDPIVAYNAAVGKNHAYHTQPATETEQRMAEIWHALLGVAIARESHFFHIGGHSLLATRVVTRVRQTWDITLSLKSLFEHPTLAAWSEVVDRAVAKQKGATPTTVVVHGLDTTPAPTPPTLYAIERSDSNAPLPLSFAQERLWFLDQLAPGDAALNIPLALRLQGALDAAQLTNALAQILSRHTVLRTRFDVVSGQPVQIVDENLTLPLEVSDDPYLASQGAVEAFIEQPFNLATGALVRWRLVQVAADNHLLLVVFHHSVCDGWSVGKFLREIEAGYRGEVLPPLPISYGDYARWQRAWLASDAAAEELEYWRQHLTPLPPVLDLPTDLPRPAILSTHGAEQVLLLSPTLSQALRDLAAAENTTLFMVMCAAFKVLLARLSGQSDIAVGTPIAGRTQSEVEPLMGIFLNTLVLRSDLEATPAFRDLLAHVRTIALDGYEHQLIPFEKLLEAFVPQRSLSHAPLFQAFFNMLTLEEGLLNLPNVASTRYPLHDQHSKFDLTLYAQERDGGIRLTFVYSTDLFTAERMAAMAAQYEALLSQIVREPQRDWAAYDLLIDAHRALLPDPTAPLAETWEGTVYSRLADGAHHAAVHGTEFSYTYRQLLLHSNNVAARLQQQGVTPQRVVAIFAARHATLVPAVLGVLKAGAIFTMLDPAYPVARLLHYLEIANPAALLIVAGAGAIPAEVQAWLTARNVPQLTLPLRVGEQATPTVTEITADHRAVLTFTSGSTGLPKGIWGRHGSLTHFYPDMAERFGLRATDRFAMLSGLAHDPLQRDLFTPLWVGASLCVPDGERLGEPGYVAQWLAEQAVTVVHLTPAMGQLIVEFAAAGSLPTLRLAFFVGDKLTQRDIERLRAVAPNVQVINLYGSTETQRAVSFHVVNHDLPTATPQKPIVPIGAGFPDVQLLILNGKGKQAGIGELGEIYVRSPHLAEGYHDPTLSDGRFLRNPFTPTPTDRLYRTGDLGRYRPDGQSEGAGRNDRQVKIRGFRIELGEIEAALLRHDGVRQAVVIRHAGGTTEQLVAYIVPAADATPTADALWKHLHGTLPDYMLPALFMQMAQLPLTPNGKLDERALPDPTDFLNNSAAEDGEARTDVEKMLVEMWAEVLGRERVGIHANFFALGGHSLLATRLIARINDTFDITVPLRTFFERPTVSALATLIETTILAEISAMDDAAVSAALTD